MNGKNLQKEMLEWLPLPIPNPDDKNHYLSPSEATDIMKSKNMSFDDLFKHLPKPRLDSDEEK